MKQKIVLPKRITSELAEETGLHIGDGSMNFYSCKGKPSGFYQLRGHLIDDREHYLKRILYLYKKIYNLDIKLREMISTGVFGFQIWSDLIVAFKHNVLGLPLGKKINVKIPRLLLEKNVHKIAVIRGIFDTDGCVYLEHKNKKLYPRIEIRTISKKLAEQLQENLISLNFRTTKHSELRTKDANRNRAYMISTRGDKMFKEWMKIIKPANPKHIKKYNFYIKNQKKSL